MFPNIRHLQKEQEQDKHGFLKIGQIVRLKRQEIMLLIYQIIRTCQMVLLDMENDGVRVGIIKTDGKIGTIFPDADLQP